MAISDLTGYTWVANNNLSYSNDFTYSINFTSNNINFTSITCNMFIQEYQICYNSTFNNIGVFGWDNGWTNNAFKTIQITGGTDATNTELIAWFEANGTLTAPATPSGKTKLGTLNIAKKMFGTLPIVKEVVDGMVVYEKQSTPSYEVTVSDSYWDAEVYIYDGTSSSGTLLFSGYLSSTQALTVTSGNLYMTTNGYFRNGGAATVAGGVSVTSAGSNEILFLVTGDGTVTVATHE